MLNALPADSVMEQSVETDAESNRTMITPKSTVGNEESFNILGTM